ncbi:glutamine amidotransferase-related protein [Dorea sp. AM58-8]|nr:hypothetical protein DXA18_11335 [Dorea sp. AM58-8]
MTERVSFCQGLFLLYGLQFHPESIMTPDGKQMIAAFIR